MRITMKDLEKTLKKINEAKGFNNPKYSEVGSYSLDGAYGGWKLVKFVNNKGGEENITHSYCSKRELYNMMQSFLNGINS